jgi:hypothetical protein
MDDAKSGGLLGDFLAEADLAAELNRHSRTIKRWRDLGIGPPFVMLGQQPFYPIDRVKAWLASGGTAARRDRPRRETAPVPPDTGAKAPAERKQQFSELSNR